MFYGRNLKDKLRQAIYELKTRVILKYNSDFNKPDCNASYEICNDLYVAPYNYHRMRCPVYELSFATWAIDYRQKRHSL